MDQAAQQGQGQNHDHAEHGGEGDGGGDLFPVGVDDGGDGGDGGVAADGVAAGDQQGHAWVQAQGATETETDDDGKRDQGEDAQDEADAQR